MWSILPSFVVLGAVAIVAVRLAQSRSSPKDAVKERGSASAFLGVATAIQAMHFGEEWAAGFHVLFPAIFGLDPIPLPLFVAFNLAWIAVWMLSVPFIRLGRRSAFFAAWFLAIAGVLNGVAHPILAIAAGGYFPGLLSSPVIGIAGLILGQRLYRATSPTARFT